MSTKKKASLEAGQKIPITEDIAKISKEAFFSILEGIQGDQDGPMSKEQMEKAVVTCIGVLVFCRGFFVEPGEAASERFHGFIKEVMTQLVVNPDQKEENPAA